MSISAAEKALRTAIKTREFAPAYYLHGDEEYLKEELVRALLEAAVDPATRDFNLDVRRGGELDAETLGSLLGTPPMMAERRVLVIRDVNVLKKDARTVLEKFFHSPAPPPDQIVVLVAPAGATPDKTLMTLATAVELHPLSGERIPKWITYYAEHDLGCSITAAAAELLQNAVGTELAQLRTELDKLGSFAAHGAIDEAAVSAVVGVQRGETLGDLLDAVCVRNGQAALALLPGVLQQPKTDAVPIVMALTVQTLAIAWARAQRDRGMPPGRLNGELYNLLKTSRSYVGRSWGEAVQAWVRAVERWPVRECDDALEALLDAELALKDTRLSSDEQVLSTLILRLCGAEQRRAA